MTALNFKHLRYYRKRMTAFNFKHLRYFWMVAKTGSIARAGEQLNITLQSISG